ncbi:hypothetical protein CC1G_07787 [Coprinopsis cinerea okayama7|uniref:Uncharacterized protein n=1 Tax=Coprinopsis cinerea (strain Okayama-7 / 130 / ATCC MYA-4618 / FGSC 9003) TaxID=240176 RepID=A8NP16_COPC7|nr:hypothetical protein CC1G_07787 [Coprinopsis cinerea okayama7\|eukprot:XP_001835244.2 hypothetical protein CC1G_07787 [Coprinopsis cinerea okayama7\
MSCHSGRWNDGTRVKPVPVGEAPIHAYSSGAATFFSIKGPERVAVNSRHINYYWWQLTYAIHTNDRPRVVVTVTGAISTDTQAVHTHIAGGVELLTSLVNQPRFFWRPQTTGADLPTRSAWFKLICDHNIFWLRSIGHRDLGKHLDVSRQNPAIGGSTSTENDI